MSFKPVSTKIDFPAQERDLLQWWKDTDAFNKLRRLLASSEKRYSFLDGPITANNPMGVHHAWGRTYKDIYQRYHAMLGENQRWQNGFDCQGFWVEVNVEKDLGFKSKRDIEAVWHRAVCNLVQTACVELCCCAKPSSPFAWATGRTGMIPMACVCCGDKLGEDPNQPIDYSGLRWIV